ncbi:MAG: alpha/beta hydrolase [Dactylosporangium sp.]|nr:alpha/beta hydrolase [Dactylosporangium sp.]NNJ59420.1 alpha/beta hydrolase [Dactylosporangium sp.]
MSRYVTSTDGSRIGYETLGAGPGLIVLSGALVRGADYRPLARALADSHTVHLVDRRGRGASGPQGHAYGVHTEVADLAAVVRDTGAPYLFGHSYGGLIALRAAVTGAVQPRAIAAYEPGASIDGSLPTWFLPAMHEAVARQRPARAMALLIKGLQVDGAISRLPLPLLTAASALMLTTFLRSFRQTIDVLPAELSAAAALDGPASAYAGLPVRTHLMIGERGQRYLRDAATALGAASPGARLNVMPGLGHAGPLRAPDRMAAELRTVFRD